MPSWQKDQFGALILCQALRGRPPKKIISFNLKKDSMGPAEETGQGKWRKSKPGKGQLCVHSGTVLQGQRQPTLQEVGFAASAFPRAHLSASACHDTARTWVSLSTHGDMLEGPEGCPKSLFPNNDPKLSKLTRASAVSGDNINWVKTCPPAHLYSLMLQRHLQ